MPDPTPSQTDPFVIGARVNAGPLSHQVPAEAPSPVAQALQALETEVMDLQLALEAHLQRIDRALYPEQPKEPGTVPTDAGRPATSPLVDAIHMSARNVSRLRTTLEAATNRVEL